jgi:hypothetical protein
VPCLLFKLRSLAAYSQGITMASFENGVRVE